MHKLFLSVGIVLTLIPQSGTLVTYAMGGPPPSYTEENTVLSRKDQILEQHFASLNEEEDDLAREKDALRRALVIASVQGDMRRRVALEKRLTELRQIESDVRAARVRLVALKKDQRKYKELLLAELREHKNIERRAGAKERYRDELLSQYAFAWPVDPALGISAGFRDAGYKKRFGMEHEAIDIPVKQGSKVFAPADAVVLEVNDRGYGYNTLALEHADGVVTVYGHVSAFHVEKGDRVQKGQVIVSSGGRPGSKGAGILTTGAHLHFETRLYGEAVNPFYYLPPLTLARAG